MGGSEAIDTSEEDMEFNQSMDQDTYTSFVDICKSNNIDFELVTMEECWRNNFLLINIPEYLNTFL